MKTAQCDRCGSLISREDDDAGELLLGEMTDEWDPTGKTEKLADLDGKCMRFLRAWLKSGGAKPPSSGGQS